LQGQGTMATMALKASPHMSWRRTAKGGAFAMGAFVLAIVGFMIMRAFGIGPAASLLSSGKLDTSDQIIVSDFAATGSDTALGPVLAEAMRSSLQASKRVRIMPASGVANALQRMARPATSRVDYPLAKEIAQREGAKAIVTGDITTVSGGYLITTKLVAASTGDVLASFQESANGAAGLIPAMDKLGRLLRGKIGESLRDVQGAPELQKVTTPSIDALRKFSEGAHYNDVTNEYDKSVVALSQAIALDSNFAMAYRKLAIALANSGEGDSARVIIEKGYALRDRIPPAERLALLGVYYQHGPKFNRPKMIATYEELFRSYPEWFTIIAPVMLNNQYESRRQFALAESLNVRAIQVVPSEYSVYYGAIRDQIYQGKFDAARKSIEIARRHTPRIVEAEDAVGHVLYLTGQPDSAAKVFEANAKSSEANLAASGRGSISNLTLVRGRISDWWPGGPRDPKTRYENFRGADIALHLLQKPEEAKRRFAAFLARQRPGQRVFPGQLIGVANAWAELGDIPKAKLFMARFDSATKDTTRDNARYMLEPARNRTLGWIALHEGRNLEAVRLFHEGDRYPDGPVGACSVCKNPAIALAFDRAGMSDSTIAYLEQFVRTPMYGRIGLDATWLAWALERLGQLHLAVGRTAPARDYYSRFAELWKNADPELQPRVAQARAAIRRIDAQERRAR